MTIFFSLSYHCHADDLFFVLCSWKYTSLSVSLPHLSSNRSNNPETITNSINCTNVPPISTILSNLLSLIAFYKLITPCAIAKLLQLTKPITKNCGKNKKPPISWKAEHQTVFDELKRIISTPSVLQLFDPKLPIFVETDASKNFVSGVLSQVSPVTGLRHPVFYYSSALKETKRGRSSYDTELEAICRTFTAFRPYLALTHFTLLCDNDGSRSIL